MAKDWPRRGELSARTINGSIRAPTIFSCANCCFRENIRGKPWSLGMHAARLTLSCAFRRNGETLGMVFAVALCPAG